MVDRRCFAGRKGLRVWVRQCLFVGTLVIAALLGFSGAAVATGALLWIDLPANARSFQDQAAVETAAAKIAAAGFAGIVLDVKAYTGFTAYPSALALHISETRVRSHSGAADGFDLLQAFADAARQYGLQLYAAINVFSEGNGILRDGPLFSDPALDGWAAQHLQGKRLARSESGREYVIDGWNVPAEFGEIVLYTREDDLVRAPENFYGVDVVVAGGRVAAVLDRLENPQLPIPEIPSDGFVLSGTGRGRTALLDLAAGDILAIDEQPHHVFVPSTAMAQASAFVNPALPAAAARLLQMIDEILRYDVDGIVLDRARYANVYTDFSPLSRRQFESYLGAPVQRWPEDVLADIVRPGGRDLQFGPLASAWFSWRAAVIQDFVRQVRDHLAAAGPEYRLGVYVGSWYHLYYREGANWGRIGFQPDLHWAGPDYGRTGYADMIDFLMAGAYYYHVSESEARRAGLEYWRSVDVALDMVEEAVGTVTHPLGGLFLVDYAADVEQFRRAAGRVQERGFDLMIFDYYYIEQYQWWHLFPDVLH